MAEIDRSGTAPQAVADGGVATHEGSPERSSAQTSLYLGRTVMGSEQLVTSLLEICSPDELITAGGLLVVPLSRRRTAALDDLSPHEAHRRSAAIASRSNERDRQIELRTAPPTNRFRSRNKDYSVRIPFIEAHQGFEALQAEFNAIKHFKSTATLDPYFRVAEVRKESKAHRVAELLRSSGITSTEIRLSPLEIYDVAY